MLRHDKRNKRIRSTLPVILTAVVTAAFRCYSTPPAPALLGQPSLYPPTSGLSQWLSGADGTNATARVGTAGSYTDVPCLSFDGVDDYFECGTPLNFGDNDFYVKLCFSTTDTQGHLLDARDANDDGFRIIILNAALIQVSFNAYDLSINEQVSDGLSHCLIVTKTGTTLTARLDDNETVTMAVDGTISVTTKPKISNFQIYEGIISLLDVPGYFRYTFEESAGTTVYDVSGNGNHGTITGATWTNDASGTVESWNLNYGFRESGTTNIPALASGASAADGNPITNPGGFVHNGANVSLVWAGGTNTLAELQALSGNTNSLPIKNLFYYSDTPASYLDIYCDVFNGVYYAP